jgi:hypothetical protein
MTLLRPLVTKISFIACMLSSIRLSIESAMLIFCALTFPGYLLPGVLPCFAH